MSIIKNPQFAISDEMMQKCTKFAQDSVSSSADKYARRKQINLAKITEDIRNGKLAEEAVYQKLLEAYPKISSPDFNIYDKKSKNWDPDLNDPNVPLRVAVKSQEIKSEIAFGRSWVFQYGNGGKFDCDTGVFGNQDDSHYVCFVSLNVPRRIGELRGLVKIQWLHDKKLFKAMKMQILQGNKMAVYYEDLEKLSDQLWQL